MWVDLCGYAVCGALLMIPALIARRRKHPWTAAIAVSNLIATLVLLYALIGTIRADDHYITQVYLTGGPRPVRESYRGATWLGGIIWCIAAVGCATPTGRRTDNGDCHDPEIGCNRRVGVRGAGRGTSAADAGD